MSAFLRFDEDALTISVFEGSSERGTYTATITLSNDSEFGLRSTVYTLHFIITPKISEVEAIPKQVERLNLLE